MRRRDLLSALAVLPFAGAACGAAQAEDAKKKAGGAGYLPIPTMTAMIVRADGRRGVLTVEAGLDTPDPALRPRVSELLPRLLDAYNTTLMAFGANLRAGQAPDLDQLAAVLQAATDRILGRRGAKILLGTTLVN